MTHEGEHLLASQDRLNWSIQRASRCCSKRLKHPHRAFATESSADKRTKYPNHILVDPENGCEVEAMRNHTLGSVVNRQSISVPHGGGRMWFHRIMMVDWLCVSRIHNHRTALNRVVDRLDAFGQYFRCCLLSAHGLRRERIFHAL